MSQSTSLKIIFALSVLGTIFSGTLSYIELFGSGGFSCPAPGTPGLVEKRIKNCLGNVSWA